MNAQRIVNTLDKIFTWIMRLAAVNALWFLYTLKGLIVLGLFPATLSAMKIFRKWKLGDFDFPIWKTFKQEYQTEFGKSNTIGWILAMAGMVLYFNYLAIQSMGSVSILSYVAFYLLIFFYLTLVIWSFPQLAHYDGRISHFFKNAIIIGFGRIHYTLAVIVYIFAVLYVSLKFPGLLPFFTMSALAFGWIWISMDLFQKSDRKMNNEFIAGEVS